VRCAIECLQSKLVEFKRIRSEYQWFNQQIHELAEPFPFEINVAELQKAITHLQSAEQGESPATAGNSDYAAALRVFNQYHDSIDSCDMSFLSFCEQRLNSDKAPNCA